MKQSAVFFTLSVLLLLNSAASAEVKISATCAEAQQNFSNAVTTLKNDFLSGASASVLSADAQNLIDASKSVSTNCQGDLSPQCVADLQSVQSTSQQIEDSLKSGNKDPVLLRSLITQLISQVQNARTDCNIGRTRDGQKPADRINFPRVASLNLRVSEPCQEAQNGVQQSYNAFTNTMMSKPSTEHIMAAAQNVLAALGNSQNICKTELSVQCKSAIPELQSSIQQLIESVKSGNKDLQAIRQFVSLIGQQHHTIVNACNIPDARMENIKRRNLAEQIPDGPKEFPWQTPRGPQKNEEQTTPLTERCLTAVNEFKGSMKALAPIGLAAKTVDLQKAMYSSIEFANVIKASENVSATCTEFEKYCADTFANITEGAKTLLNSVPLTGDQLQNARDQLLQANVQFLSNTGEIKDHCSGK